MKNNKQSFKTAKWETFKEKIKEKRFYIVLLCCIMAVSATYFAVNSVEKITPNNQIKTPLPTASPTPLPDLTKSYVTENKNEAQKNIQITPPKQSNILPSTAQSKPVATPKAQAVNTEADTPYQKREKFPIIYPVSGEIITPHSEENLIYSKTLDDWRTHTGIDIKSIIGTEVVAADDGIIEDIYTDELMGITIVIDHLNGLKSIYSNLSTSTVVGKGNEIKRGEVISAVGDSAISETAQVGHLHFELYDDGKAIDPLSLLEK